MNIQDDMELATPDHWPLAQSVIFPRSKQQRRLVRYLLHNQNACTVDVNRKCAIGNISDVSAKCNPDLHRVGLFVACKFPPTPLPNRFGEQSQMYLWYIAVLPNAPALIKQHYSGHKKAAPD